MSRRAITRLARLGLSLHGPIHSAALRPSGQFGNFSPCLGAGGEYAWVRLRGFASSREIWVGSILQTGFTRRRECHEGASPGPPWDAVDWVATSASESKSVSSLALAATMGQRRQHGGVVQFSRGCLLAHRRIAGCQRPPGFVLSCGKNVLAFRSGTRAIGSIATTPPAGSSESAGAPAGSCPPRRRRSRRAAPPPS